MTQSTPLAAQTADMGPGKYYDRDRGPAWKEERVLFNIERADQILDDAGIDALVLCRPRNFYYATEYWASVQTFGHEEPHMAAVYPKAGTDRATLIAPLTAFGFLAEYPTWMPRVRPMEFLDTATLASVPDPTPNPMADLVDQVYVDKEVLDLAPDLINGIVHTLRELGLTRSHIAFDDLRVAHYVSQVLPDLRVGDAHDLMIQIRAVKTPKEIERLRRGVEINEGGIEHILPLISPGAPWTPIADEFRRYVEHEGGEVLRPEKALQFGAELEGEFYPELAIGNTNWNVRAHQPIIFESWGRVDNYYFDFSRTVHVGEAPPSYVSMCDEIHGAWREAIRPCLKAGVHTSELFAAGMEFMRSTSVPTPLKTLPFFHSIGLDIIELPSPFPAFGRVGNFVLEPDMVINAELLYFGRTLAPFHIESTFRILDGGAELLQTMPESLQVLA